MAELLKAAIEHHKVHPLPHSAATHYTKPPRSTKKAANSWLINSIAPPPCYQICRPLHAATHSRRPWSQTEQCCFRQRSRSPLHCLAFWDNCSSISCTGDGSLMYGLMPLSEPFNLGGVVSSAKITHYTFMKHLGYFGCDYKTMLFSLGCIHTSGCCYIQQTSSHL